MRLQTWPVWYKSEQGVHKGCLDTSMAMVCKGQSSGLIKAGYAGGEEQHLGMWGSVLCTGFCLVRLPCQQPQHA